MTKTTTPISYSEYVQDLLKKASECDTVHAPYSARYIMDQLCDVIIGKRTQGNSQP